MVTLLVYALCVLLIAAVAYWGFAELAASFGAPAPLTTIGRVAIVLVAVVLIVRKAGIL